MSTLTKVLIILLTVSSIFLCGIVVTYVANADNYKEKYDAIYNHMRTAEENAKDAKTRQNNAEQAALRKEEELGSQIASLKNQITELQSTLSNTEREKALLLQKVNNWTTITKDFADTTDKQGQQLNNALDEINRLQAEMIRQRKELKETTATLVQKLGVITTLDDEKKRLLEDKTELQKRLNQVLRQYGKAAAPTKPVTPKRTDVAKPVRQPATVALDLRGTITGVDSKHSLAEISIGSAHGVKENMKFHVTRGSQFVCDLLILEVDSEKAVGILDLIQQLPKIGDRVSTNL